MVSNVTVRAVWHDLGKEERDRRWIGFASDQASSRIRLTHDKRVYCLRWSVSATTFYHWTVPPTAKMAVFSITYKCLIRRTSYKHLGG